ncbi:hypothetical protein NHP190012_09080 [Helicobacter sp. NHP19-012]|uniref:Periplasmic protein n=1 Tax=Helicobacter gastrofelis TaxID=2849642 RepID=A0ABN6I6W6_9HELI|nr:MULTISPECIES: hypothetical protein [unclassified Helicobacter]BCZ19266.1 hypothetical protein NHP190012_09080 [Helicobacter sp. NHP19-012]GMB96044.1 hypothetical protein NHP22001_06330 [Helicobacter sp. NHP22-001]
MAFERLVKNFVFFIVFVVVGVVSVSLWLYPKMIGYQSQDADARQQAMIVAYQRQNFVNALQVYRTIKQKNSRLLKHPNYAVLNNHLNTLLHKHFTHIQIRKKNRRIDLINHCIYEELRVSAHARNLDDFYAFFDGLVGFSAHMEIEFPITIAKSEHALALDFGMRVAYKAVEP